MKFENEGTWFYFDDEKPEDGGICLKSLTLFDLQEIRKATVKKMAEYKRVGSKRMPAQRFEFEEVDEKLAQEMQWDMMIADWKNVEDRTGTLECTKENKLKMMKESPKFALFVAKSLDKLVEDEPTDEEVEKN